MKSMMTIFLLFVSVQTSAIQNFAAQDSVAVFFNTHKTVVLINEEGSERLHAFMDLMGVKGELHHTTEDGSLKIDCGRTAATASCTFRFLPSSTVQFGHKIVTTELGVDVEGTFETSFESSRGDKFILEIADGKMQLTAQKAR